VRLRQSDELREHLAYLITDCGMTIRPGADGLQFLGRTRDYERQGQEKVLHAVRETVRMLESMVPLQAAHPRSYSSVGKWISYPVMLPFLVALLYLGMSKGAFSTFGTFTVPAGLVFAVFSALLFGIAPAYCLRRSPFTLPLILNCANLLTAVR
jgi:hypothetical protein